MAKVLGLHWALGSGFGVEGFRVQGLLGGTSGSSRISVIVLLENLFIRNFGGF